MFDKQWWKEKLKGVREDVLPLFFGNLINWIIKGVREDVLPLFFGNLINWIIIGFSISLWKILRPPSKLNIVILWILTTLFIDLLTSLTKRINKYHKIHKALVKEFGRIPFFVDGFSNFVGTLIDMDVKQTKILKKIFDDVPQDFGGVIIGADEERYIRVLEEFINTLKNSFFATLRGGYKPEYTISWFFKDTILSSSEKLSYLGKVGRAPLGIKIRLIILNEKEMGDFCIDSCRNIFFNHNTNVHVFGIASEELQRLLVNERIMINGKQISNRYEAAFIYDDYAILDGSIGIKHNGRNSLYLGTRDQILKMLLPFELLRLKPEKFRKLDSKGIYQWNTNNININWSNIRQKEINQYEGWSHIFNSPNWRLEKNWVDWEKKHCPGPNYFQTIIELSEKYLKEELETLKEQGKLAGFSSYFNSKKNHIDNEKERMIEDHLQELNKISKKT